MAETAGLVFGVIGVAGLFTACVESIDIIVRGKDFSEEFDLLCTQVRMKSTQHHTNESSWTL